MKEGNIKTTLREIGQIHLGHERNQWHYNMFHYILLHAVGTETVKVKVKSKVVPELN
jgi:hypothetical protein